MAWNNDIPIQKNVYSLENDWKITEFLDPKVSC